MSDILKFAPTTDRFHEERYEQVVVIPDDRTLLKSNRDATCAKCGGNIPSHVRFRVEYPNGPPIYFHEACLNDVKNSLAEVYEAAVKSILKNVLPNMQLPGER